MTNWRQVVGWEGKYEVSDDGGVRSLDRLIVTPDGQPQFHKGRILNGALNGSGYRQVRLSDGEAGIRKMERVHRLVAAAFIPNPDRLPYVNHIDADPLNNNATNLEWCTQAQNLAHARRLGRMADDYWSGRRSPNAALTDAEVRMIRSLYAAGGWSLGKLGARFDMSKRAIGRLLAGETYADV